MRHDAVPPQASGHLRPDGKAPEFHRACSRAAGGPQTARALTRHPSCHSPRDLGHRGPCHPFQADPTWPWQKLPPPLGGPRLSVSPWRTRAQGRSLGPQHCLHGQAAVLAHPSRLGRWAHWSRCRLRAPGSPRRSCAPGPALQGRCCWPCCRRPRGCRRRPRLSSQRRHMQSLGPAGQFGERTQSGRDAAAPQWPPAARRAPGRRRGARRARRRPPRRRPRPPRGGVVGGERPGPYTPRVSEVGDSPGR
mmetsp:Transcript_10558/g.25238  ORF Transcript_10558/g.25238 Transcript_10558/m.25238 type:complete len:249 (-) Transcript_10558:223-969(-)